MDISKRTEITNKLSELSAKQEEIIKERGNQEQYMKEINELKEKNATNLVELQAIDLAIKTIQELSEEIYDSFGGVLNDQVSKIISKITNGKYSEVRIDDQLRVMVKSGNSFISMDYLSTGTPVKHLPKAYRYTDLPCLLKAGSTKQSYLWSICRQDYSP